MSISLIELVLYAGALFVLFMTPGPVWVAMIARTVSGGFHAAWPLALGVALGDAIWALGAIFGVSLLVAIYADFLIVLRYGAAVLLVGMGAALIFYASKVIHADSQLAKPGYIAGFSAGFLAVMANPKASLFYLSLLPNFFVISSFTLLDIFVICLISMIVPLLGNFTLALLVEEIRQFLAKPKAVRRTNIAAGAALIAVGLYIGLLGL